MPGPEANWICSEMFRLELFGIFSRQWVFLVRVSLAFNFAMLQGYKLKQSEAAAELVNS